MNIKLLTPEEFAENIRLIGKGSSSQHLTEPVNYFIDNASSEQLFIAYSLAIHHQTGLTMGYLMRCFANIGIRTQEQVLRATERHMSYAEQLTGQTQILITEAKNLNAQNKILVSESRWLRFLTIALLVFTVALLVYTVCHDYKMGRTDSTPAQIKTP